MKIWNRVSRNVLFKTYQPNHTWSSVKFTFEHVPQIHFVKSQCHYFVSLMLQIHLPRFWNWIGFLPMDVLDWNMFDWKNIIILNLKIQKSVLFLTMMHMSHFFTPLSPRSHHNIYDDPNLGIFSDHYQVSIFLKKL